MPFTVELVIEGKPVAKDPEGETIMRDLMQAHGFPMVSKVRTAKLLRITLDAKDAAEAKTIVEKMNSQLRLANPVAQNFTITVKQ